METPLSRRAENRHGAADRHKKGYRERCNHRADPGERNKEQDVPINQRTRPADCAEKPGIECNVPDAKREEKESESLPGSPPGDDAKRREHDDRGGFPRNLNAEITGRDELERKREAFRVVEGTQVDY